MSWVLNALGDIPLQRLNHLQKSDEVMKFNWSDISLTDRFVSSSISLALARVYSFIQSAAVRPVLELITKDRYFGAIASCSE